MIKDSFYQKTVTIERARHVLGTKANTMTDKEIGDLLAMLRLICERVISSVVGIKL